MSSQDSAPARCELSAPLSRWDSISYSGHLARSLNGKNLICNERNNRARRAFVDTRARMDERFRSKFRLD